MNGRGLFAPDLPYQLVLRTDTLTVLLALLPYGEAAWEVLYARDVMNAGHLHPHEVRELAALLAEPSFVVTERARAEALADLTEGIAGLDLDELETEHRRVSVFCFDPRRDAPRDNNNDNDDNPTASSTMKVDD